MKLTSYQKFEIYKLIAINTFPIPKKIDENPINIIIDGIERILNGEEIQIKEMTAK